MMPRPAILEVRGLRVALLSCVATPKAVAAALALGGPLILPALLITALAGGLAAAYLALRLRRCSYPIPYAPFISGGALAVLLWQGSAFVSL